MAQKGSLTGYKVLDATHFVAGPYCTKLLAGYGASVIKIEKPGTGDGARRLGPFAGDDPHIEKSLLYSFLNTDKKSITLNLKTPTGVDIFKRLLEDADILIENFEPRVMPSLGLDYDTLSKINPRLVMTSITNFGQSGPYRDYKAAEITEYALSGLMKITGEAGREPLKLGLDVAQLTGGQNAVPPTLASLYSSQFSGKGCHIDISIMDYCSALLSHQTGLYSAIGHITERMGNLNQKGHPWGNFPCRDGWVTIAAAATSFAYVAEMMGIPELKDPKFETPISRLANRDELDSLMLPWLIEHGKKDPFEYLNTKRRCAAGWVRTAEDLINCPQLKSQEYYSILAHPVIGKAVYPGGVCKMNETPWQINRAPLLGEHNREIFAQLGYTKGDLIKLAQSGII
ncbi:CaiB/BaiF CoA transferase family protein [Chloroflexota bacterium]